MAFTTYKEWSAYRSSMLVSVFVGPVFFLVQVFIWKAVYASRATVNGFSLSEMLLYFGISSVIGYLIWDCADGDMQALVHNGGFLTFMLRPLSYRAYAFAEKVGHRALAFWVEVVPVYLLFMFVFRVRIVPHSAFWAALSLALSFAMMFLVNYSIGTLGFWFTRTSGLGRMFLFARGVFAGSFIPLTFFPDIVQKAMFFMPFQFIAYVPIRVFLGSYTLGGITLSVPQVVAVQAAEVAAMYAVSEFLWRQGIKRFTGVGA